MVLSASRARLQGFLAGVVVASFFIGQVPTTQYLQAVTTQMNLSQELAFVPTGGKSSLREGPASYVPAGIENYVIDNAEKLGFNTEPGVDASACTIWKDPTATTIHKELHTVKNEMIAFAEHIQGLRSPVPDLRLAVEHNQSICDDLGFSKGGVGSLFPSGQLSQVPGKGYMEPITTPLRHPFFCEGPRRQWLLNLGYLVHDFPAICRSLKRTSRTVFIDMGASLQFHVTGDQPAVYITNLYRKFGIPFDHIYAYEVRPTPPEKVFEKVPQHMRAAYHWINVGVSPDPLSDQNPWNMLRNTFNEDDFVVVKLDIDTPSVEMPLVQQLLDNEDLQKLVDHFYFEHHVQMKELAGNWLSSRKGSIQYSLSLFQELRKKGIAAHSWV